MSFINRHITFRLNSLLAFKLIIGFIVFTIIGTLTHELGHIVVAKALGYETSLHYGHMNYYDDDYQKTYEKIWKSYQYEIENNLDYPDKEHLDQLMSEKANDSFWIISGGPLQTMFTGTIGLFLLYRRRTSITAIGMKFLDWLLVFLSLFWLRELFNPITGLVRSIIKGTFAPLSGRSDELRLARHLEWWEGSISLFLASIAILIGMYVVFKRVPKNQRFTLIVSGLLGGVLGFFIWLEWLGPVVMP